MANSGFLQQGRFGTPGNFELVLPSVDGLAHYFRDNSRSNLPWSEPNFITEGQWSNPSLIHGSFGPLEVVARQGVRLAHFHRTGATWHGPNFFATGLTGDPAFIQGTFGVARNNFEVVAPSAAGGLVHFFRPNGATFTQPWSAGTPFGSGTVRGVAMLQSNFGNPGHLEVVATRGDRLDFYWRDPNRWNGPFEIAQNVGGTAAFLQSSFGTRGNFELVVPRADSGMDHYWRDNDDPSLPWRGPFRFGTGRISAVSCIQSSFGPGNLELIAREGGRIAFYFRTGAPSFAWSGPFYVLEQALRVHARILADPISFTVDQMFSAATEVFQTAHIRLELIGSQSVDRPDLLDVDVGACDGGVTAEQTTLFGIRGAGVGARDLVIYFVRSTNPGLNGCASHPSGRPGAIVASGASRWTLAHEIGHVLGLDHVGPTDRLMMGGGTWNITNPPPEFSPDEVRTMRNHELTIQP